MTRLALRPYRAGDDPPARGVPVSAVVLALNEELNIGRCLMSLGWADQVVVVDSGSTDATVPLAQALGAEVVTHAWPGFSAQREFVLRLPSLRNDWVYFADADEWVSPQLALEIARALRAPDCAAFAHRLRLVFMGTWIRHCGWYRGSWVTRLVDRRYTRFDGSLVGERAQVDGRVRRLANDIVDQDRKGLAVWLHKHVRYAELEAGRWRGAAPPLRQLRRRASRGGRPLPRAMLKELVYPWVPGKPAAMFCYMYLLRLGLLDGLAGLRFCLYHAWFQLSVNALRAEQACGNGEPDGEHFGRPSHPGARRGYRRRQHRFGPAQAGSAGDPRDPVPGTAVPATVQARSGRPGGGLP